MHGQVLGIDPHTNEGQISGADGGRYPFGPAEWRLPTPPQPGQLIDFEPRDGRAADIFAAQGVVNAGASGARNRTTAGLLGIFLGSFGGHKFYLGYQGPAMIMLGSYLGSAVIGMMLIFTIILSPIGFLLLFVPMVIHVIALIEGIIYLTMTDEQFEATYVRGHKDWF